MRRTPMRSAVFRRYMNCSCWMWRGRRKSLPQGFLAVREKQQSVLRPVLEKLVPVIAMSAWGSVPDALEFDFLPVRDLTDRERAELAKLHTETVIAAYSAGLVDRERAARELERQGRETGVWARDASMEGKGGEDGRADGV